MMDLDVLWMTSGVARVRRVPGQPGVRARVYAALRRPVGRGYTEEAGTRSEAEFGVRAADAARLHAGHERLHGLFPRKR